MLSSVQTMECKTDVMYLRPDPNLVIYAETVDKARAGSDRKESYGFFNLYPAVYPSVVPYPARYECDIAKKTLPVATPTRPLEQTTVLSPSYPFFDLCKLLHTEKLDHSNDQ